MHSDTPATNAPTTPSELSPDLNPNLNPSLSDLNEFDNVIGMKLSDLIREGSQNTEQAQGWGNMTETACALSAAAITLNEKGYGLPS